MILEKANICHTNSITHEGKVVVVATDANAQIWYTIKQDGFEDSYLSQPENERTGWEEWTKLDFPDEGDDLSVAEKEKAEFTDAQNSTLYFLRSRYKTAAESAVAPVQLVSGLGYLYVFRQSKSTTLLVDRFVLDGMTNKLGRKLEVRFKRSRQKHKPSVNQKKGTNGLLNTDSLDFRDIVGKNFYEPTTEISLVDALVAGWFSVVLLPTTEQDKYRWHIFFAAKDSPNVLEIVSLRASDEGLFDIQDYTVIAPRVEQIPGIIKRNVALSVALTGGIAATKYDVQRERVTDDGPQLLREAVHVMVVAGTAQGTVAIDFAVATDGTLSRIAAQPATISSRRVMKRQLSLPASTLREVREITALDAVPAGQITGFYRGSNEEVRVEAAGNQLKVDEKAQVKLTGGTDRNRLYSNVTKIDEHTFEVTPDNGDPMNWELIPKEADLTYNGMVSAYALSATGKLRVTARNHGLADGDQVQLVDTKGYGGTYDVTGTDEKSFSLRGVRWQAGTAINLQAIKRNGIMADDNRGPLTLPITVPALASLTVSLWAKGGYDIIADLFTKFSSSDLMIDVDLPHGNLFLKCGATEIKLSGTLDTNIALKWAHWAFLFDQKNGKISVYLNGAVLHSQDYPKTPVPATKDWALNFNERTRNGAGSVAGLSIWSKVRSEEEIKASMYLSPTGLEANLIGYWPLDAIIREAGQKKLADLSPNQAHVIIPNHINVYVSAASLHRKVSNQPAISYFNEELFAVAERATYEEAFDFKMVTGDDSYPYSHSYYPGESNPSEPKIFEFSYKGKKTRNATAWEVITASHTEEFNDLGDGWYRASARFTVPDGIALVRSFGIGSLQGTWDRLEIRNHEIIQVADSISEAIYNESLTVPAAGGNPAIKTREDLQALAVLEAELPVLRREKKKAAAEITRYEQLANPTLLAREAAVKAQQAKVAALKSEYEFWLTERARGKQTVKFCEHPKYQGRAVVGALGSYVFDKTFQKKLSSLDVPAGLEVLLFPQDGWAGEPFKVTAGATPDIRLSGNGFDDKAVSYRVQTVAGNTNQETIQKNLATKEKEYNAATVEQKRLEDVLAAARSSELDAKKKEVEIQRAIVAPLKSEYERLLTERDRAQQTVTFYEHPEYKGRSVVGVLGSYGFEKAFQKQITSLRIPQGLEVLLFSEPGWKGLEYKVAAGETPDLRNHQYFVGSDFNDRAVSYRVQTIGGYTNKDTIQGELGDKERLYGPAKQVLEQLEADLAKLNQSDANKQAALVALRERLAALEARLTVVQNAVAGLSASLVASASKAGAGRMSPITGAQDERGLITQLGILPTAQPISRLSATETCEGNVQVSYFDEQGRMRHVNYDAAADSRNAFFEQWLPEASAICLNLAASGAAIKLTTPVALAEAWTIETWFAWPLNETAPNWNVLASGPSKSAKASDRQIVVECATGQLGTFLPDLAELGEKGGFFASGYDMSQLAPGWYHLAAVGKDSTTRFYLDGYPVGDTKATALKTAQQRADKAAPAEAAKAKETLQKVTAASLQSAGSLTHVGNAPEGACPFGRLAWVGIWAVALNDSEIATRSKTLLSGNEPGLAASLPLNEAAGTTATNQTGNPDYNATITTGVWWGCPALIGNLGSQVAWFNGSGAAVRLPPAAMPAGQELTISFWAKRGATRAAGMALNGTSAANGVTASIQLDWGDDPLDSGWIIWECGGASSPPDCIKKEIAPADFKRQWVHLAFTKNTARGVMEIYRNGVLWHSETNKTTAIAPSTLVWLGKSGQGDKFYEGAVAELSLWNKARTATEIQADMHRHLTGTEPGLVAYYPMRQALVDGAVSSQLAELAGRRHGTPTNVGLVLDNSLPVGKDAVISTEYSTIGADRSAMMRRFFAAPSPAGVDLLPDKRVEELELKWIGNGQFEPTLLGYIEGAPPVPSENLTLEWFYNGATSVELTLSDDVEFQWNRSSEAGLGGSLDLFLGTEVDVSAVTAPVGVGFMERLAKARLGFKGNLDFNYQFLNDSSIGSSASQSMADKLELFGNQEREAYFPHLGKRFIPKNVGYALVVSALADVFVSRLKRSGRMIGYQMLPVENVPPDINTITFLINPAYTMNGSLDGLTGSSATSKRFFKHVPEMRAQFGSLYPASYYRLQEAYDLKQQIEQKDKDREAYFAQFNSLLVDEASLSRETQHGAAPTSVGVNREEDKPDSTASEQDQKAQLASKMDTLNAENAAAAKKQAQVAKEKQAAISKRIADQDTKSHASASFAAWQKKMEDIQIRAGKRNIVNTYVWDADGGLRSEMQSFASTAEHSIGGSFSLNAGLGVDWKAVAGTFAVELTAQATVNLTQTMTKTEKRSRGIQLNVDLSGVESRGITDYNDLPLMPGEKVNRYRFMSFYLEGSTNNFTDFFSYVVDPEWLASNGEEARALRQAKAHPNKAWRVLHRVTYVERPALMGFGQDVRQLPDAATTTDIGQLRAQITEIQSKLDTILKKLAPEK